MPIAKIRYCQKAKQDISICYECIGNPEHHPLFLVAGLNCSLIYWPLSLCEKLASIGFYVVRFDNRDVGLSSRLDHLPQESVCSLLCCCNCCIDAPYGLDDMAMDALELARFVLNGEVLEARRNRNTQTQKPSASKEDQEEENEETNQQQQQQQQDDDEEVKQHQSIEIEFSICGMSQGGAISQYAAIMEQNSYFTQSNPIQRNTSNSATTVVIPKLKSLSLIMTFAEKPPVPSFKIIKVLTDPPVDKSRKAFLDWGRNMAKAIFYIPEEWSDQIEKDVDDLFGTAFDRIPDDQVSSRHRQAVTRQQSRIDLLKRHLGKMPTVIIHGAKDQLVPVQNGRQLHKLIPNSRYFEYPTMSHSVLPRHSQEVCEIVAKNAGVIESYGVKITAATVTVNNNEPVPSEQTPLIS